MSPKMFHRNICDWHLHKLALLCGQTSESSTLHLAAEGGHSHVVKLLLEAGAQAQDENAVSVLFNAFKHIHDTCMTCTWHICDTYMTHTWHIRDTYMTHTWHIHDTYITHTVLIFTDLLVHLDLRTIIYLMNLENFCKPKKVPNFC